MVATHAKMGALEEGMGIHQNIIKNRMFLDAKFLNTIPDMHAKCQRINRAHHVFDKIHQRNGMSLLEDIHKIDFARILSNI